MSKLRALVLGEFERPFGELNLPEELNPNHLTIPADMFQHPTPVCFNLNKISLALMIIFDSYKQRVRFALTCA